MSTLYLIRHGQASFGAADYDVLSELGAAQSRVLGGQLIALASRARDAGGRGRGRGRGRGEGSAPVIDALYTGPRRRHLDTTRHLRDGALEAARAARGDSGGDGAHPLPEPIVIDELDEYPTFELVAHWMPILHDIDPGLAAVIAAGASASPAETTRAFRLLLARWARGELDTGGLETFAAFSARVRRGLMAITEREGRGVTVAVVTSGGPISIAVQLALGITDERTLEVAWVLANTSITEFRWRAPGELGLVALNAIPHLSDPALITYR